MPPRKIPSADFAREKRRVFQDAESTRQYAVAKEWPARMQEVGRVLATSYSSNKWGAKEPEEFKHLAESPCCLHVVPGLIRDVDVVGPVRTLRDMPRHITELAPLISVDVKLYQKDGRLGPGDKGVYTIVVKHAVLFCGKVPNSRDEFLCIATPKDGVVAVITGDLLKVTRDGICG